MTQIFDPSEFTDKETKALDRALSAAEAKLQILLRGRTPREIAAKFAQHVQTHLRAELDGATHHRNSVRVFRRAIAAGKDSA